MGLRKLLIYIGLGVVTLGGCATLSAPPAQDQARANDFFSVGLGFFADKKYPESLQAFEEASRLARQEPNFEMHRALALFYVGREAAAIEIVEKTCHRRETFPECYNNLSSLYLKQKRYSEALTAADSALSVATYTSPELAWTHKGLALHALGRPHEALAAFSEVKQAKNSRSARCQNLLFVSRSHLALAEFTEARRNANVARELCDGEVRPRIWQAYVEYRLGEIQLARDLLNETIQTFRDPATRDEARSALNRLNREEALAEPDVIL